MVLIGYPFQKLCPTKDMNIYNSLSKIIFLPEDMLYIIHMDMAYYDDKGDEFFVDFLASYWRNMSQEEIRQKVTELILKQ